MLSLSETFHFGQEYIKCFIYSRETCVGDIPLFEFCEKKRRRACYPRDKKSLSERPAKRGNVLVFP